MSISFKVCSTCVKGAKLCTSYTFEFWSLQKEHLGGPGIPGRKWPAAQRQSSTRAAKSSHGALSEQWTKPNPSKILIMFHFCDAASAFRPAFQSGYGQVKQQSHTTVPSELSLSPIHLSLWHKVCDRNFLSLCICVRTGRFLLIFRFISCLYCDMFTGLA